MSEIIGTSGDDVLVGTSGDDTIDAGYGNDSVDGGDGNDTITGTAESETITGGAGGDVIDVSGVLLWTSNSNPFGTGHLRLTQVGANVLLSFDYDGTGGSSELYTLAVLQNVTVASLNAGDFVL